VVGETKVPRKCISITPSIDTIKTVLRRRCSGTSPLLWIITIQTQWKKRKQTPEERKEAKRAKLDPDQTNSAAGGRPARNEKDENGNEGDLTRSQIKRAAKKAKKAKELELPSKREENGEKQELAAVISNGSTKKTVRNTTDSTTTTSRKINDTPSTNGPVQSPKIQSKKPNGITHPPNPQQSERTAKVIGISEPQSSTPPIRKPSLTNGIKSSPSPSVHSTPRSPPIPTISSPAPEIPSPSSIAELRARLAARISQARIARKAIGTAVPGAPQTREAILQARAKRKAKVEEKIRAKKQQQKSEEVKHEEESSSDDEIMETGLTFGRVMINDTEIDAGKGEIKNVKRKKGPSDAKGRLGHLVAREERLSKMDPEKAGKAIENDRWHHALLSARGEKVKDDMSLLKKTIARREREKKKSKREWDERTAKVEKGKEDRQRKREENIAKRREEKGTKKGGKKVAVKTKKPLVKKKRPGFEGGRVKIGRK
jgi:hypothetical protein